MATEPTAASGPRFERPPRPLTGPRQLRDDLGPIYAANGLIGLIFAATGPVVVILAVGTQGGLSEADLASWLFGAFFINGAHQHRLLLGSIASRWRSSGRSPARCSSGRRSATSLRRR